jgi:serine/threonine-protein kinase
MELPTDPADGWSLVSMGTGQSLELSYCVLTVQDYQEEQHGNVAIVAVQPRRVGDTMTMMDPQLAMGQSASVTLDRSIARGEATLVSLADEAPLTLHWKQGLLATSRRLIETGGTATSPKWFEKIDLDLESVTAYCRQGLHHMRRAPGKSHQFALNVSAKHCILMTEPDVPLYEFVGMSSLLDEDLQAIGDYNRYPFPDVVFLRVRSGVAGESPQDFAVDRCQWSTESHFQVGIPWLRPLSRTTPAHRLTKNDFATDAVIRIDAGFDPEQLPDVP